MEVAPERGRNARTETLRVRGVERYAAGNLLAAAALWREALTQAPDDIQAQAYVAWIESRLAMEAQVPGTTRAATSVSESVFSAETVDPIGELSPLPAEGAPEGTPGWHRSPRTGGSDEETAAGRFEGVEAQVRRFLAHTPTRPNLVPLDDVPVLSEEKVAELAALQRGGAPPVANGHRRTLPPGAQPAATPVPSPSNTPTRVAAPDPATVLQLAALAAPATIVMPASSMPSAPAEPVPAPGTPPTASTAPQPAAAPAPPRGPVPSPFRASPPSSSPVIRSPTPSPFARPPEVLSPARTTAVGTAAPAAPPSDPAEGTRAPAQAGPTTLRGAAPRRKPVTVEMDAEPEDRVAPRSQGAAAAPVPASRRPSGPVPRVDNPPRRPSGPVPRVDNPPRRPSGPVPRVDDPQGAPHRAREDASTRKVAATFPYAERTLAARLAYDRGDLDAAVNIAEEVVAVAGGLDAEAITEHASKLVMIYEKVLGRRDRLVRLGDLPPALDPRSAFVLSRVDGSFSIDDLIDVSGMDRAQAFRQIALMLRSGALLAG